MKKLILLVMLISGIAQAQSFDFNCAPDVSIEDGFYYVEPGTLNTINICTPGAGIVGSDAFAAIRNTHVIFEARNNVPKNYFVFDLALGPNGGWGGRPLPSSWTIGMLGNGKLFINIGCNSSRWTPTKLNANSAADLTGYTP